MPAARTRGCFTSLWMRAAPQRMLAWAGMPCCHRESPETQWGAAWRGTGDPAEPFPWVQAGV